MTRYQTMGPTVSTFISSREWRELLTILTSLIVRHSFCNMSCSWIKVFPMLRKSSSAKHKPRHIAQHKNYHRTRSTILSFAVEANFDFCFALRQYERRLKHFQNGKRILLFDWRSRWRLKCTQKVWWLIPMIDPKISRNYCLRISFKAFRRDNESCYLLLMVLDDYPHKFVGLRPPLLRCPESNWRVETHFKNPNQLFRWLLTSRMGFGV